MAGPRRAAQRVLRACHLAADRTVFAAVRGLLIGAIRLYRLTISPLLGPTCRFHPSCSAYGLDSIRVHGAAKGVLLTAWRLLRCNPFNLGGLDPVPARGQWRPDIHPDGRPRAAGLSGPGRTCSREPAAD